MMRRGRRRLLLRAQRSKLEVTRNAKSESCGQLFNHGGLDLHTQLFRVATGPDSALLAC